MVSEYPKHQYNSGQICKVCAVPSCSPQLGCSFVVCGVLRSALSLLGPCPRGFGG